MVLAASVGHAQERQAGTPAAVGVDGRIALHALMSLGDTHLRNVANTLTMVASTDAARSADWGRIKQPLTEAARLNVPAVHWFALPDGTYWTVQEGRASATLADRPYFPRLLAEQTVIGDLVVSRATGTSAAIVAVPVRGPDGKVVGALGASVQLDSLSRQLRREMHLQPDQIFYTLDATPIVGLHSDPGIIFLHPLEEGDPALERAIREMLIRGEGVADYSFRGTRRTVQYCKSPVTGWLYVFGTLQPSPAPLEREVLLGGLFSLTGDWSGPGRASQAAMELAVDDVNQYLEGNAARLRFRAVVEDTRLEPAIALEKVQALQATGVQLLIGPQSSAEVARLKPYVDANHILLVSQSSTAGSLAIAGDNIFRFTPADNLEAVAVSAMIWEDGIRAIVPVWRDDAGNAGLEAAVRARFSALGGTVLNGVKYAADTGDFSASVSALQALLDRAITQHGADRVAVYLAAFDEVVELFTCADSHPVLGSVRWYGSDGVARNEALVKNPAAAGFATRTGFANPTFGSDEGARDIWEPLSRRIHARTGIEPDAFALAVYDAVWVVARGYVASGATEDIDKLKRAVTTAAASGYGATGWTVLSEAGDRRYGDFDFWAVRMEGGTPRWMRVARYESRTGRLIR
jgi:branched-chain amino acid transport system substrate-binding protein